MEKVARRPMPENRLFEALYSPAGIPVKPLSLVAPVFGSCQWVVPDSFIFPPASSWPPRKEVKYCHSS